MDQRQRKHECISPAVGLPPILGYSILFVCHEWAALFILVPRKKSAVEKDVYSSAPPEQFLYGSSNGVCLLSSLMLAGSACIVSNTTSTSYDDGASVAFRYSAEACEALSMQIQRDARMIALADLGACMPSSRLYACLLSKMPHGVLDLLLSPVLVPSIITQFLQADALLFCCMSRCRILKNFASSVGRSIYVLVVAARLSILSDHFL